MGFSFRDWYEANGERLNEKRKAKYHNDPKYRDKVLKTNQDSRAKRKSTSKKSGDKRASRARTDEKRWKTVEAVVDGVRETMFSIGALAQALGCSIQAIRLWERQKLIPATPIRTGKGKNGDRLYTRAMVENIREILTAQGRLAGVGSRERNGARALKRFVRLASGKVAETRLFLIGALAKAVGRNVVTLEQLEAKGFLPRTPFRASSVGRRLYTADMIEAVKLAFEDRGGDVRGEEAWKGFHDDVLKRWTAQGMIGAVLVQEAPEKVASNAQETSHA